MSRLLLIVVAATSIGSSAMAADPIYLTTLDRLEPFGLPDSLTFVASYFTNVSTNLAISITKASPSNSTGTQSQGKQTPPSINHAEWKPVKDAAGKVIDGQITLKVSCDLTGVLTPNSDSVTIDQSTNKKYDGKLLVVSRDAISVVLKAGAEDPGTWRGGSVTPDTFCPGQSNDSSYNIVFNTATMPTDRGYLYLHRDALFADTVNVSVDNNGMLSSSDSSSQQQITAILTELAQTAAAAVRPGSLFIEKEIRAEPQPKDARKACYDAVAELLKSGPFYQIKNVGPKEFVRQPFTWPITISSKVTINFVLEHSPLHQDFEGFYTREVEDNGRPRSVLYHSGLVAFLPVPARAKVSCHVAGLGSAFLTAPTTISLYAQRAFIDPQRDFLTNPQDTLTFNAGIITTHKYTGQSSARTLVDTITAPVRALLPSVSVQQNTSVQSQAGKPDQITSSTQTTTGPPKSP